MFSLAVVMTITVPTSAAMPLPYVECVPVARQQSGIQIFGDAHTWWGQAEGRFTRGNTPRKGAVLAFKPHGAMTLGHVAAVSKVIDDRTILVTHANWSLIDGRRGQVERDVRIIDVSEAGNWSQVRVWYAPLADLGTTHWPVHGFIYPGSAPTKAGEPRLQYASLSKFDDVRPPQPTGRLAYLGKMLTRLK